jgi:hypothetical protein
MEQSKECKEVSRNAGQDGVEEGGEKSFNITRLSGGRFVLRQTEGGEQHVCAHESRKRGEGGEQVRPAVTIQRTGWCGLACFAI